MRHGNSEELIKLETNVDDINIPALDKDEILGLYLLSEISAKKLKELTGMSNSELHDLWEIIDKM